MQRFLKYGANHISLVGSEVVTAVYRKSSFFWGMSPLLGLKNKPSKKPE
jgi:hypothetical protein